MTVQNSATLSGECIIRYYENLRSHVLELLDATPDPWLTTPAEVILRHQNVSGPNPTHLTPDLGGGGGVIEEGRETRVEI